MPSASRPFATALIIFAVAFNLGVIYGNWPYDYHTLWVSNPSDTAFSNSLRHYETWANTPNFLAHVHHVVMFIGLVGLVLKLYKPTESNKLFDGASTFLYVVAICIYINNLKQGANAIIYDAWGEVDQNMGLNIMAASQVMICFALLGIIILQLGQYYSEYEDKKMFKRVAEEEKAAAAATGASTNGEGAEAGNTAATPEPKQAHKRAAHKTKRKV